MFSIVLVEPEIPPNTGNIIRLAANTGCALHLIEPLGFSLEHAQLRRAGLDYHEYAPLQVHASWAAYVAAVQPNLARLFGLSTKGTGLLQSAQFAPGDTFVFGNETSGLNADALAAITPEQRIRLPMRQGQRSLNLANSVAVTVFEAWRQCGYLGGV